MKVKLKINKVIITQTDKGNTVIILKEKEYSNWINYFFQQNFYIEIKTDPIYNFQNTIRHDFNRNRILIPGNQKWKYTNLIPSSPNFRELITNT